MINPKPIKETTNWKLRGGYPCAWILLSYVVLTAQFVGIIAGAAWNTPVFGTWGENKILPINGTLPVNRKPLDPCEQTTNVDNNLTNSAYISNHY